MWIKIKNVKGKDGKWVSGKILASIAYITVHEYMLKQLQDAKEKGEQLEIYSMSNILGIVGAGVRKLGYELVVSDFSVVCKTREKQLLRTLKSQNLAVSDKGHICFHSLQHIFFNVDGYTMSYDDFCHYELPEGKVFKLVFDNGYSYIGSEPFRVTSRQYADRAIYIAKQIGRIWSGWQYGFRLNDDFSILVSYGEDESYSEVSFS